MTERFDLTFASVVCQTWTANIQGGEKPLALADGPCENCGDLIYPNEAADLQQDGTIVHWQCYVPEVIR